MLEQRQQSTIAVVQKRGFYTRNSWARLGLFILLTGAGCTNVSPLSLPIFILFVIELMMWTLKFGAKGRSRYIFGSTNPAYWFLVSLYLTLYSLCIWGYNIKGVPPLTWTGLMYGERIPLGLEQMNMNNFVHNFLQVHFHFFCVVMSSICAFMLYVNARFRYDWLHESELPQNNKKKKMTKQKRGTSLSSSAVPSNLEEGSVVMSDINIAQGQVNSGTPSFVVFAMRYKWSSPAS